MGDIFEYKALPTVDKEQLDKGNCPWCLTKVCDGTLIGDSDRPYDICQDCGDKFYV